MIHSLQMWHEIVPQLQQDIGFHVGGTLYLSETENTLSIKPVLA